MRRQESNLQLSIARGVFNHLNYCAPHELVLPWGMTHVWDHPAGDYPALLPYINVPSGPHRDRTGDLIFFRHALFQLS